MKRDTYVGLLWSLPACLFAGWCAMRVLAIMAQQVTP